MLRRRVDLRFLRGLEGSGEGTAGQASKHMQAVNLLKAHLFS